MAGQPTDPETTQPEPADGLTGGSGTPPPASDAPGGPAAGANTQQPGADAPAAAGDREARRPAGRRRWPPFGKARTGRRSARDEGVPASPRTSGDETARQGVPGQAGGTRPRPSPRRAAGSGQPGGQAADAGARSAGASQGDKKARRQRDRSARATAERRTAMREAAARRGAAAEAADLLWTRPPEKPSRYSWPAQLSDMTHGWLDGRRGLPRLPELAEPKPRAGLAAPAGEPRAMPFPATASPAAIVGPGPAAAGPAVGEEVPTAPPAWLQTPRMVLLRRQALELIRAEEEAYIKDCARYRSELSRFHRLRDSAAEVLGQARNALELARQPLSEEGLLARRLAEQKSRQDYPESFVRARRQAEWERRVTAASQAVREATTQLAYATREAELRENLIRDRMAVARAAAHRHHEFHIRRIATYLQQLARTHKQGADLNMLLIRYQVGPNLPEWTANPPAANEGSGQ